MQEDKNRRAEDAERLPAEKLEWEAPAEAQPVGHVVTWNKGGSGEHNSIEPIGKSGYSLAASLPEGTMIWTTSPAAPAVDAAKYTIAESHAHGAEMYERGYQKGRAAALALPVDAAELGNLKALAEAATQGEWAARGEYVMPLAHVERKVGASTDPAQDRKEYAHTICLVRGKYQPDAANAAYIAAANPAAILRIAALVAQQAARIDELERDLKDAQTQLLGPDLSVKFEAAKVELNAAILATKEGK